MVFKAAVAGFWMLVIGLACVALELSRVRLGHRVYRLQRQLEASVAEGRELEIEYNRLVSPDVLEEELEELFQSVPAPPMNVAPPMP